MENEFSQVALNIGDIARGTGPADEATMVQYTTDYINLTRKYSDELGDAQVKKRLTDEVPRSSRGAFSAACSSLASARSTESPARGHNLG